MLGNSWRGDQQHVAAVELTYYSADAFPKRYRNTVFAAQWGTGHMQSLSSGETISNGYAVVAVRLHKDNRGRIRGESESFAKFKTLWGVKLRPIDVTVGADGALYIAEYQLGEVYRVTYRSPDE